jgi:hypothetical protein
MKYILIVLLITGCSKDISFDPTVTIGKELIKFLYKESNKKEPVIE